MLKYLWGTCLLYRKAQSSFDQSELQNGDEGLGLYWDNGDHKIQEGAIFKASSGKCVVYANIQLI